MTRPGNPANILGLYNPLDYQGVGDNAHDDSMAVYLAVYEASQIGGTVAILAPFKVTIPINVPDNVSIWYLGGSVNPVGSGAWTGNTAGIGAGPSIGQAGGSVGVDGSGNVAISPTGLVTILNVGMVAANSLAGTLGSLGGLTHVYVPTAQAVTTALTVPSGVCLEVLDGGLLTFSGSGSLTIAAGASLRAGPYQIFAGTISGTVTFAAGCDVAECYAEWWGATGAGATHDDQPALQVAANTGIPLRLLGKTYWLSQYVSVATNGQRIVGEGIGSTHWRTTWQTSAPPGDISLLQNSGSDTYFADIDFNLDTGNPQSGGWGGNFACIQYSSDRCTWERCRFQGFEGAGLFAPLFNGAGIHDHHRLIDCVTGPRLDTARDPQGSPDGIWYSGSGGAGGPSSDNGVTGSQMGTLGGVNGSGTGGVTSGTTVTSIVLQGAGQTTTLQPANTEFWIGGDLYIASSDTRYGATTIPVVSVVAPNTRAAATAVYGCNGAINPEPYDCWDDIQIIRPLGLNRPNNPTLGALTAALTAGTTITSVTANVTTALTAGQQIWLVERGTMSRAYEQVTVTAAVGTGSGVTVPIQSHTLTYGYGVTSPASTQLQPDPIHQGDCGTAFLGGCINGKVSFAHALFSNDVGVDFEYCANVQGVSCYAEGCQNHGVSLENRCVHSQLVNCSGKNNGTALVIGERCDDCQIIGGQVIDGAAGVGILPVTNCTRASVIGVRVHCTGQIGVASGVYVSGCTGLTIRDCELWTDGAVSVPLNIQSVSGLVLQGNRLWCNEGSQPSILCYIGQGQDDIHIVGNRFEGPGGQCTGLQLQTSGGSTAATAIEVRDNVCLSGVGELLTGNAWSLATKARIEGNLLGAPQFAQYFGLGTRANHAFKGNRNLGVAPGDTISGISVPAASTTYSYRPDASPYYSCDAWLTVAGGTGVGVTINGNAMGAAGTWLVHPMDVVGPGAYSVAPTTWLWTAA